MCRLRGNEPIWRYGGMVVLPPRFAATRRERGTPRSLPGRGSDDVAPRPGRPRVQAELDDGGLPRGALLDADLDRARGAVRRRAEGEEHQPLAVHGHPIALRDG